MKITVCQIDANRLEKDWDALANHVQAKESDFVLLPEMPFSTWFAASKDFDSEIWNEAVKKHQVWTKRLPELAVSIIAGTMPVNQDNKRQNAAFIWSEETGLNLIHNKTYLPNEDGFWEATWYQRGEVDFQPTKIGDIKMGFMICTEMWFYQHARYYSIDSPL